MTRQLILEDFGADATPVSQTPQSLLPEDQRLSAFEDGYKAGWDDANKADSDARTRISADLEKNLQELSFTFHEARAHIIGNIAPLLRAMAETVLPTVAQAKFADTILETVNQCLETAGDAPLTLTVNPLDRVTIETVLPENGPLPVTITEQNSLAQGQVFFKVGAQETVVDMAALLSEISASVDAFLAETTQQPERLNA